MASTGEVDIGPLTWVKGEIDQALSRAVVALRAFASSPADASQIKQSQIHFHQAHGALQIVGLDGVARFSEEVEALLVDIGNGNAGPRAIAIAEKSVAAISTYLEQLLAGEPDLPLKLFSHYQEVVAVRNQDDADPVDLFFPNLSGGAEQNRKVFTVRLDRLTVLRAERARFMRGLLRWLRKDREGMRDMQKAAAGVASTESDPAARKFWGAADALLEGIAAGAIVDDAAIPPLCNRIERQIKRLIDGTPGVAERLLREVLYYAAIAKPITQGLRNVQAKFNLQGAVPATFELKTDDSSLLPRLRGMREAVVAAKSAWMRYTAGHIHNIGPFVEQATQMLDRSATLGRLELTRLVDELLALGKQLVPALTPPAESLSLEVATTLLFIEDAVDRFASLPTEFTQQCESMVVRLIYAREGRAMQRAFESPLLDEMSRQAQERVAIAQLMGEIQSNLRDIEAELDGYFRDQSRRTELWKLDKPIAQVVGAFRILNDERAEASLARCAEQIKQFTDPDYVPAEAEFEAIAATLSGLGFYVEGLQHGKADFDAAMRPIRASGAEAAPTTDGATVEDQIEQQKRDTQGLIEAWQASPGDPSRKEELRQHVETLQQDASLVADNELERRAQEALSLLAKADALPVQSAVAQALAGLGPEEVEPVEPSAQVKSLADASREVIDAELLAVFVEEAAEVIDNVDQALNLARTQPSVMEHLRTIRRGFHTLKGSGRMVGLMQLAEAAWAVEKLMNRWLEEERPGNAALFDLVADGRSLFAASITALKWNLPLPDETRVIAKAAAVESGETIVVIGDRRLTRALYQIFVGEALAHLAELQAMQSRVEAGQAVAEEDMRAPHTLAGVCGSVGFTSIGELAGALEEALVRLNGIVPHDDARTLIGHTVGVLEQMVQLVVAREEPQSQHDLVLQLRGLQGTQDAPAVPDGADLVDGMLDVSAMSEPSQRKGVVAKESGDRFEPIALLDADVPTEKSANPRRELDRGAVSAVAASGASVIGTGPTRPAVIPFGDDVDPEVLDLFVVEGQELLPAIAGLIRGWRATPDDPKIGHALQRDLHTLKGSARMAGAMQIGELLHEMETQVEGALTHSSLPAKLFDELEGQHDAVNALFDRLQEGEPILSQGNANGATKPHANAASGGPDEADAGRGGAGASADAERVPLLRVRADAIDRLVNQAGEVAIARSRIEGELKGLKATLSELTENISRLRTQLREIEIQAETQIQSKLIQSSDRDRQFDPLEFDRYTRFQELTRMMAESVNDVGAVHQNIARAIDETDAALQSQARTSRDLQQDLLRIRMVPFKNLSERLYRIVRQAAKEAGKRANLDIQGSQVELDRSVLERITAPFEHMLRNAIAHGIEPSADRLIIGKPEVGEIRIEIRQEGNEVMLAVADDGKGLDLARIRSKAIERGLLAATDVVPDADVAEFIFQPGFSTATEVTQLAGRGIGMDVVKSEIIALGGRVEVTTDRGKGTRFIVYLPLTLAMAQAVVVQAGTGKFAIPGLIVDQVRQVRAEELAEYYRTGVVNWQNRKVPFHYLPRLLGDRQSMPDMRRNASIIHVRSGSSLMAVHADEVIGNQEIVVKNTGPMLARVTGITGATVLGSGEIVLILNPVVMAAKETQAHAAPDMSAGVNPVASPSEPIVMIVDDSLTVRKITGRLLSREGYHVVTARDGVDAVEQLGTLVPDVMVIDIEMPRMDGFDLTRHIRSTDKLKHLPIVIVTSRTADKHRNFAMEIGVNAFLGKPYRDDELLATIANYLGDKARGRRPEQGVADGVPH
jgi:chemosensory pili system protein ChpA (sensor histidine kinase/response regulator)